MTERTIVIGDVHGCYFELMALLEEIRVRDTDRLIFVGDLIAKGPSSREVLEFIRQRRKCESVLGNHEHTLLRLCSGDEDVEIDRGHLRAAAALANELGLYMEQVSRFPPYLDLGDYLVVHAGIRPGLPPEKQSLEDLTELRMLNGGRPGAGVAMPWYERYRGHKTVIFGHTVFATPLLKENAIGIDTGCVYGGSLTAVVLPERRLVSMPAVKAYTSRGGASWLRG
ncbi:MAG: metallophosphoesterase [Candidatus Binatia bacterium]